jgi:hypothetical protein
VHDQLVVGDRLAEVGLDRLARYGAVADDLVEHRPAPAAGLLGAVHGGVGIADQVGGVGVRAGGQRDADAAADEGVAVLERERLRQRLEQALRDGDRVVRAADVLADEDELVAAEAGGHLVAADGRAQALGDRQQEAVAGVVAEAVVDDLEAVEVDEQDGDAAAASAGPVERALQAVHQQQPAREAGQRVAQELELVRPPRRDVGEARGEDEAAVDQRPAPRVGGRLRVAVDRMRLDDAEHAVVQDDVGDRQEERHPVLVEGQQADHHEEVEVRLDGPVPQVDEQRGARDEAGAGRDHPPAQRDARQHRDDRERDHRPDVEEDVAERVAAGEAEQEQAGDVGRQDADDHPVAALEEMRRQHPSLGHGGAEPAAGPGQKGTPRGNAGTGGVGRRAHTGGGHAGMIGPAGRILTVLAHRRHPGRVGRPVRQPQPHDIRLTRAAESTI